MWLIAAVIDRPIICRLLTHLKLVGPPIAPVHLGDRAFRLAPGWVSAAEAGTSDEDFHSPTGCTVVIVYTA